MIFLSLPVDPDLTTSIRNLTATFPGRVGVCALDADGVTALNGKDRFPLQSVMKLVVSLAVLDAADHHRLRLDDTLLIRRKDLSLYVQPIAKLVGKRGYRTTYRDLIFRTVTQSDSAAGDILLQKLGGAAEVRAFLHAKGIEGVRIDRDERHLQTEIVGLRWKPEYVDAQVLDKAIAAVRPSVRTASYIRYQHDPRDTATPIGMAALLQKLATGKLLSPSSTKFALDTMAHTVTFPDRLKAGVPAGWTFYHKTGTSGSWRGVTAATNDVGIVKTPDGRYLSVVVFIADTKAPSAARAALMAKIAALVTSAKLVR